ncbi:hypothetical protein MACJ_001409 [Theileria orientalis]|uniref:Uncharacterized protein n=1 Tax=Theileria orientalis TaxID=68886 RepID=A0A976QW84_THEOR|nr:hypothetical protein MACJ_001409 [Theileria orientalis]
MEVDWNKYKYLQLYKKYSSSSAKTFSTVVDKILSYIPRVLDSPENDSHNKNSPIVVGRTMESNNFTQLQSTKGIVDENTDTTRKTDGDFPKEALPSSGQKVDVEITDEHQGGYIRKYNECSGTDIQHINSSHSTESSESFASDLIFDMKYCSLQLPIPPELYQEEDYTLETNVSPSITEYDVCYDEELASNYVMVEPFRFLSKVHVTFDKESGEQWCCCYYDAKGNYTRKRFKTSHIAFDTAKMLASRCREAAERSFHNIWILKHKNLLDRPIPQNLTDSFLLVVNKIKDYLAKEHCMVCCVDKIRETLHSGHKHDLV